MTEEQSLALARNFVKDSKTFTFDGIEDTLQLTETLYPDIENCWQFVFEFDSSYAGYGDRTGQMLAQVITPHEAIITVENGAIKSAVIDGTWDMINQHTIDDASQTDITKEESQQIALDYLLNSPTFVFDGMDDTVELTETITARCPSCWVFEYEFQSRHAGYGNRTGQMLAQVITNHKASIAVEKGVVTRAIMDNKWNMVTQEFVTDSSSGSASLDDTDPNNILVGGTPGSCGYSWDPDRYGWHRAWEEGSFISADEKPEWKKYIPADQQKGSSDLTDNKWSLVSFGDQSNPTSVLEGTDITIKITEEDNGLSVEGSAGCNRYFGSFEITDDGLKPGMMGATEMWCMDEGVMDQETEYLKALGMVTDYEIDGNTLKMTYEGGVLVFTTD